MIRKKAAELRLERLGQQSCDTRNLYASPRRSTNASPTSDGLTASDGPSISESGQSNRGDRGHPNTPANRPSVHQEQNINDLRLNQAIAFSEKEKRKKLFNTAYEGGLVTLRDASVGQSLAALGVVFTAGKKLAKQHLERKEKGCGPQLS